jgi:hypothetical protein
MPEFSEPVGGGAPRVRIESASRLLEAEDVANYLGIRTDWVYREVRAGRLADIKTTMVYTHYAPGANEAELVNGVFQSEVAQQKPVRTIRGR